MNKFITYLGALLFLSMPAQAANQGIKFQAKIKYSSTGDALNESGVSVNVRILSPNGCVLWEENHPSLNIVQGYLSLVVGQGNVQGAHPAGTTMKAVFDNSTPRTGLVCVDGSNAVTGTTTYTPTSSDIRKVRVYFNAGVDSVLADFNLRSNGYAVNAESLEGKSASDFLLKTGTNWPMNCPVGEFVNSVSATGVVTCLPASGGGAVTSVAGRTGAVVLSTSDISGLGSAALLGVGTAAGTVAAGDDVRFTQIRGIGVSATAPTTNQVLQYNGTQYVPATLPSAPVTSVAGRTGAIVLTNVDISGLGGAAVLNVGTAAGTVAAGNDSRITGAFQASTALAGDLSGTLASATVARIRGVAVSATAPTTNQVLQYNGTQYVPATLPSAPVTSVAGKTGVVTLVNTDISGLGGAAVLNVGTAAGTVAAGDDARITGALQSSAFNAYVASAACTTSQTMYWNSVSSTFMCQSIASATNFSGSLVGDVTGTQGATAVTKIRGVAVSATAPTTNQVLQYNGTQYVPATLPSAPVTSVAGKTGVVTLVNTDISGLGGAAVLNVGTAAGTVAAGDDARFTQIRGVAVSATAPTTNQVLQYNGTQYVPATLPSAPVTSVAGKTGVVTLVNTDISGLGGAAVLNVGTAAGTVAAGNDSRITGAFQASTALAGDLSGTLASATVARIRGVAVSATAPTTNQVLQYNGTQYVPATLPSAPVTSVAGKTGVVTLVNTDISGLGGAAVLNVGTAAGTVAAGDDVRFDQVRGVAVAAAAPTTGQSLVYDGTAYTPTTVVGMPTGVNAGDIAYYNGTNWVADPFMTRKMSRKITDFSGTSLPAGLTASVGGTGASCSSNSAAYAGYFGGLRCSTGSSSGGWTSVNNGTSELKTGKAIFHKQSIVLPTLSTSTQRYTLRIGLSSAGTTGNAEPAAGVFFRYSDNANSGKFLCVSRNASTESSADSGVTVAAGVIYELEVRINAAVTQATCFVNGVAAGTVNANIPAASGTLGIFSNIQKSVGTTTTSLDVLDWETVIVK